MLAVFIDIIKKKSYIHGSFCDIIALAFSSSECSCHWSFVQNTCNAHVNKYVNQIAFGFI